ncbi:PREDICTED: uncharacterized protein LOC109161680 [Ipomoea nil]|uniref:uncharacterized protein LOC109161680 n=1 Tax=Ipomoea nil TaxID=35883 RepID=UPI000900D24D|nr:PREDICTED: uncharacterized protein LOC109161680 [Ipomoea nil]
MASWPPLNNRSTPADGMTAGPSAPVNGNTNATHTGHIPTTPATPVIGSSNNEVTFDPQSQSNPYFLHISENPALELVSTPLDGANYHSWARAMTMALSCKNKVPFINGSILKPSTENLDRYLTWERCNNIVSTWIVRTLSPTIARSVLWIDTAYGIWNDLRRRFSQQDLFRIAEIKCEIYQTKQNDDSLNEYFTRQKLLWDELGILRPQLSCLCSTKCECGKRIDELNEQVEKDKLSIFLIGLHEKYTGAGNQIMLMRPLPDVNEAYSMIAQQERQFHMASNGFGGQIYQAGENNVAGSTLLARSESNYQQGFKKANHKKPVCTYCGYTDHTHDKCYKKHGYPPGWKSRPKSQSVNQTQGPLAAQQQYNPEDNKSFTQDDFRRFMEFMHAKKSYGDCLNSPFDHQQTSQALANTVAVDFQKEGMSPSINAVRSNKTDWIIDSGATHHIVCDLKMLKNQKKAHNMYVNMPNGQQAAIQFTGTVCLSENLVLHNTLYIPEFHYNLVSVGAFIKDSSYVVKMYSDQCVIQDASHGRMIGRAELMNGLYYLVFPCFTHPVCSSISVENKCIL